MKKLSLVLSSFLLLFSFNIALAAEDEEVVVDDEIFYVSMNPHFTTNLSGSKGNHLLQLKANVEVIGRDTKKMVELHMPEIRHELIMYFTSLNAANLKGSKNRAGLANKSQEIVQKVIAKHEEDAKVTSFLIQSIIVQ